MNRGKSLTLSGIHYSHASMKRYSFLPLSFLFLYSFFVLSYPNVYCHPLKNFLSNKVNEWTPRPCASSCQSSSSSQPQTTMLRPCPWTEFSELFTWRSWGSEGGQPSRGQRLGLAFCLLGFLLIQLIRSQRPGKAPSCRKSEGRAKSGLQFGS